MDLMHTLLPQARISTYNVAVGHCIAAAIERGSKETAMDLLEREPM